MLEEINKFSKVSGYKSNVRNYLSFFLSPLISLSLCVPLPPLLSLLFFSLPFPASVSLSHKFLCQYFTA